MFALPEKAFWWCVLSHAQTRKTRRIDSEMKMPKRILAKSHVPDKWDLHIEIAEQKAANILL
jgi:hypothetical protein